MKVAAKVIPQHTKTTPESAEVAQRPGLLTMSFESTRCWNSAFIPNMFTKIFIPRVACLVSPFHKQEDSKSFKKFTPQIIEAPGVNSLMKWEIKDIFTESRQVFLDSFTPIFDWETKRPSFGVVSDDDKEVEAIFLCAQMNEQQKKMNITKYISEQESDHYVTKISTKIRSFPDHFGTFWQKMIDSGQIALYPKIEIEEEKECCLEMLEKDRFMQSWSYSKENCSSRADSVASFYPEGDLDDSDFCQIVYKAKSDCYHSDICTDWINHIDYRNDESSVLVTDTIENRFKNFLTTNFLGVCKKLDPVIDCNVDMDSSGGFIHKDKDERSSNMKVRVSKCCHERENIWSTNTWHNIQQVSNNFSIFIYIKRNEYLSTTTLILYTRFFSWSPYFLVFHS